MSHSNFSIPTRRSLLATGALIGLTTAAIAQSANQPIEGKRGGTILGPRNGPLEQENPDVLQPPVTDNG